MSRQTDPEQLMKRFLLGISSEEERTLLEERFFADDAQFEEIEILEEELIDLYVSDELPADDRARFEQRMRKSPALRERVEFAKLFKTKVGASELHVDGKDATAAGRASSQGWWKTLVGDILLIPPAPRAALAMGLTIVLLASVVSILGWINVRRENRKIFEQFAAADQQRREMEQHIANQRLLVEQLSSDLQQARQQDVGEKPAETQTAQNKPEPTTAFLSLVAATRSAGQKNSLTIGPSIKRIRLTVNVGGAEYTSYKVSITTVEGEVLHREQGLRASGNQSLTVQVPASALQSGDYIVNVDGLTPAGAFEPVTRYSFQLIKTL